MVTPDSIGRAQVEVKEPLFLETPTARLAPHAARLRIIPPSLLVALGGFPTGWPVSDYLDGARFRFERGDVEPDSSSSVANASNNRAPHRQIALL